mgnify:CR=1 FL=1
MFRRVRESRIVPVAVVLLLVFAAACATTPIGKAVQSAHVQKQIVEASAVEFAKLHLQGNVPEDSYLKGKEAYGKWAKGEVAVAKTLADWKRLGDTESGKRLSEALRLSGDLFRAYVDAVGQFVDLKALRARIGG